MHRQHELTTTLSLWWHPARILLNLIFQRCEKTSTLQSRSWCGTAVTRDLRFLPWMCFLSQTSHRRSNQNLFLSWKILAPDTLDRGPLSIALCLAKREKRCSFLYPFSCTKTPRFSSGAAQDKVRQKDGFLKLLLKIKCQLFSRL